MIILVAVVSAKIELITAEPTVVCRVKESWSADLTVSSERFSLANKTFVAWVKRYRLKTRWWCNKQTIKCEISEKCNAQSSLYLYDGLDNIVFIFSIIA